MGTIRLSALFALSGYLFAQNSPLTVLENGVALGGNAVNLVYNDVGSSFSGTPQLIVVRSSVPVNFSISPVGPWLVYALVSSTSTAASCTGAHYSAAQEASTTPAGICIAAVQPSPLVLGYYSGALTLTATTGSPLAVPVGLSVFPQGYLQLTSGGNPFDQQTVPFSFTSGTPAPVAVQVNVLDPADATHTDKMDQLSFAAQNTDGSAAPWVVVQAANVGSKSYNGKSPAIFSISVDPTKAPAGSQTVWATLSISSLSPYIGNDYVRVTATLPQVVVPQFTTSSQSLSFTTGGPTTQTVTIGSTAASIPFQVTSDSAWLTATPTSGVTPQTLTVSVNPAGLSPNTYTGMISIADSTGVSSTSSIGVFYTVGATTLTQSLPHFAVGGGFATGVFVLNTSSQAANFSIAFHDDSGNPVSVPFSSSSGNILKGTIQAHGSAYYEAGADPAIDGSGLVTADPGIVVQALFRELNSGVYYEAAVPSQSGSTEFLVPFDQTTFTTTGAPLYTGLAIANLDQATTAKITCIARDSNGTVISGAAIPSSAAPLSVAPLGHWQGFNFGGLANQRGTIDCVSNTNIAATALRAIGNATLSSLVVVSNPETPGQAQTAALPHFAVGGGFATGVFVLNTSSQAANFSIAFHDDNGNPIPVPFGGTSSSTLNGMIPAHGSGYYEASSNPAIDGSGLVTADPGIVVQALFRELNSGNYYEAAVPGGQSGSKEFLIPFDQTTFAATGAPLYTGLAIANLDQSNMAKVTCVARDSTGTSISGAGIPNSTTPLMIPALGHWQAFNFSGLTNQRGTIDCVSTTNIAATALRAIGNATLSSLVVIQE